MATNEESAQLKSLRRQRATIKGQTTRILTFLTTETEAEIFDLQSRKDRLLELGKSYEEVQHGIEQEDIVSNHELEREQFERQYFQTISLANKRIQVLQSGSNIMTPTTSVQSPTTVMVKQANSLLPKIEIKPFDGNPIHWHNFHDTFKSLVHESDELVAVQKFHLLKNALRGDVTSVISSLNVTEANYFVAWELLRKRCNRPRQIVNAHWRLFRDLPDVARDAPANLRNLAEQAQMHVTALKSLQQPVEHWDTVLVNTIVDKLDKTTRRAWERTLDDEEMPTFNQLIKFINKQARGDDLDIESLTSNSRRQDRSLRGNFSNKRQTYVATENVTCTVCKQHHALQICPQFLKLTAHERLEVAKGAKLCINCLRLNHMVSNCKSGGCRKCNLKHNTLLHFNAEPRKTFVTNHESNDQNTNSAASERTTLTATYDSEVLLGTAKIIIFDKHNKQHTCRVLLDGGSQTHFITQELADKLQLSKRKIDLTFSGLNQLNSQSQYSVDAIIKSNNDSFSSKVTFMTLPKITGSLPSRQIDRSRLQIPNNLKLADPEFHKPGKIEALLGNTLFFKLLSIGQIKLHNESIILQKSRLGWLVTGEADLQTQFTAVRFCHTVTSLETQLHKFWEIEEIPNKEFLSAEDKACKEHFLKNTSRNAEGRFIVRLPFNEKKQLLGESRSMALKRFYSLERRLHANQDLFIQYGNFLKEYEQLGHMSDVSQSAAGEGFYLPHHAVIKEASATTKVRVVFDASAKGSTGISLNDTLLVGPTIQDTLYSILLRFRCHSVVMTADIEKMFRQVIVHPADRKYQKILWRDALDKAIKTYELNTVTYGTASASYLAVRSLQQLAVEEASEFPAAAEIFQRDFYMDDLLTGAESLEATLKIRSELISLADRGGFHLRQWASNDNKVVNDLETNNPQRTFYSNGSETRKTLGIVWNSVSDEINYTIKPLEQSQRVSKRSILSQISQLFDPLGLLGPIVVREKILMQQLWKANINWDESIPQHIHNSWSEFRAELAELNNFAAPRKVIGDNSILQLHGFCDASESAYGACLYIRCTDRENKHIANLLCAKSRVAPVKSITLPRLELCAAKLLVDLYKETVKSLQHIKFDKIRFWSDSSIVLQWIKTPSYQLKTFVANRINDIQVESDPLSWAHVPTSENPADYISRGQSPNEFLKNHMWLKGPHWLIRDEQFWPAREIVVTEIPEKRKLVALIANKCSTEIFDRYSSITLLTRVIAYVIRFSNNCKTKVRTPGELTALEVSNAHDNIMRLVQAVAFSAEIRELSRNNNLTHDSKINNLNPFLDEKGLIRVGGRLKYAPIKFAPKHPILLPSKHKITELVIRREHERQWHAGIQATLNAVRQNYWPIDGKNITRRIIHRCIRCYKTNPKIPSYIMGNLPAARVTQARPFENAGIDYCGPFFIKERKYRNRNRIKVYTAVFVCFATKAIHLEVVTDLTTEACIAALKRIFARRGKPKNIYSDNATNFVGARNEIVEIQAFLNSKDHKDKIQHFSSNEGISWHFIPPRSPHFGGLWEAGVKSFKSHLRKTVGDDLFTYEQFNTFVIEIESILNSRPILPLSSDPNDFTALTPGHFIIGGALTALPEHDLIDTPRSRLSHWQHLQKVKQHFWARWHREYLQELHTRSKWHTGDVTYFQEGTLVLIHEDNVPPLQWKLGRIIETHPGKDGIVRVATVRTAHGIYKRSVKKLAPLPLETQS